MNGPKCNLCGSSESYFLHQIPDLWLARNRITADFYQCCNCGLIYQFPQPLPETWPILYPENYSVYQPARSSWVQRLGQMKRSQVVLRYKSSGKLLDIGCGNGEFLLHMRSRGEWELVGIEHNKRIAESLKSEQQLDIFMDPLEDISFQSSSFEVITMWDVLEHLPDPRSSLQECRRILKPGGVLVLRLPNYESIDAQLFGKCWAGLDSPRHFFVFGKTNIGLLLDETGFSIQEIHTKVGEYLNFVKSIQFWLTWRGFNLQIRNISLGILRSLPLRILAAPLMTLKDRGNRGSEMIIVAK
jgi:2-polyprenyl-3-methyl-5-hydroxy-6-metoxy-1,4-benzoquinol methylase